jgi:hypothetical protein
MPNEDYFDIETKPNGSEKMTPPIFWWYEVLVGFK